MSVIANTVVICGTPRDVREPDYLIHLENLVRSLPDLEAKMESRKRLISIWTKEAVN